VVLTFKPGDIITSPPIKCRTQEDNAPLYMVVGEGKWPGYIKTYCIREPRGLPKHWKSRIFNFNINTVSLVCDVTRKL